jgi:hypothetical protein
MEKQLIEEISDGVATLTFNRPDSTPIMEGLLRARQPWAAAGPGTAHHPAEGVVGGDRQGRQEVLQSLCSPS